VPIRFSPIAPQPSSSGAGTIGQKVAAVDSVSPHEEKKKKKKLDG
jgi:hypothetical protein